MNNRIEEIIIYNLIHHDEYHRKVLPFIKHEYFSENVEKVIFKIIESYSIKYNKPPSIQVLNIAIEELNNISEENYKNLKSYIDNLNNKKSDEELQWLIDKTEEWCKDRAVYNAVRESISILDNKEKPKGEIPRLLSDALSVSFDTNIGHDFIDDSEKRYEFYHKKVEKIPFDLDYFNKITDGGIPRKTLNIILAGTNVGKSLALCHFASNILSQGRNVLYITLEMSEEEIAKRIDANMLNIDIFKLMQLSKEEYDIKINRLKSKTDGKLIIKEYPTASANVTHFEHLLSELKLKRKFIPDVIFVDYLNIASSTRKVTISDSYIYAKAIAEELRGLAVKHNVPVFTATQSNRSGYGSSDPGLENTSESFGVPATADFMIAMITTEELESMNQILFKQLKNRYNDVTKYKRFPVGIDRSKMKLYDLEEDAINEFREYKKEEDDVPLFDKGSFGGGMKAERFDDIGSKIDREKFKKIK